MKAATSRADAELLTNEGQASSPPSEQIPTPISGLWRTLFWGSRPGTRRRVRLLLRRWLPEGIFVPADKSGIPADGGSLVNHNSVCQGVFRVSRASPWRDPFCSSDWPHRSGLSGLGVP